MRLSFLIWMAIAPALAAAETSCSTIDLAANLGVNFNQMDTSWCHAITTTLCLTKHLQNVGVLSKADRIHPLQIAAALPLKDGDSVVQAWDNPGTMIGDMGALDDATIPDFRGKRNQINQGLCRESDLAPVSDKAKSLFNTDLNAAMLAFRPQRCRPARVGCSIRNLSNALIPLCEQLGQQEYRYWTKLFHVKCQLPWPQWYVHSFYNGVRYRRMLSFRNKPEKTFKQDNEDLQGTINTALESGELAATGYDVSFLERTASGKVAMHWSAIVGRHQDGDGKCIYSIKNSWGSTCDEYNPKFKCNSGIIEVPDSELLPHVHSVHYFDRKIGSPPSGS